MVAFVQSPVNINVELTRLTTKQVVSILAPMKNDPALKPLAKQLDEIRWDKRLTQRDLAEKMGVTDAYISAVLTGRKAITAAGLDKFIKAMAVGRLQKRGLHILGARAQGWQI